MSDVNSKFPIDAVITWVDGADPKHIQKLQDYLASIGGERPRAANPARFHHSGELDYCVTSLLRFAPWLRCIYIVTDNQVPDLIKTLKGTAYEDRVKIIDHQVIFAGYEQHLPTFNSISISAMLWRIPDLAENFLFLNDDFALIQPVTPEDFFRDDTLVVRGHWRPLSDRNYSKRIKAWLRKINPWFTPSQQRAGFLAGQELCAKYVDFNKQYFQIPHNPHAWKKSTFQDFCENKTELFDFNISFRLRSSEQFIPESLSAHLELKAKTAHIDNSLKTLQLKPADQAPIRVKRKLADADKNHHFAFVCVQSIENAPVQLQKLIFSWLDKRIGRLTDLIESHPHG